MLAVVEIAIVLCSVFLVAIPAIAADQSQEMQKVSASTITTASEDDYVLDIYGNANEDDTIDMRDLTYVKLIFFGKKPETELADAKYDGKINPLDFIQIKLIIVGKEKELTVVDSADRIVTVKKPIESIIAITDDSAEALRVLGEKDKIVGVSTAVRDEKVFFPELSEVQCVGKWSTPDYEMILSLNPDLIISYKSATVKYLVPQLGNTEIALVALDFYRENIMREEFEKLGYILDKREEAEKYIDFFSDTRDTIVDRVSDIPDGERVRVYLEGYSDYKTYVRGKGGDVACTAAGGINIAADLEGHYPEVDPEWVLVQDPDVIVRLTPPSKIACGYDIDDPTEIIAKRKEVMNRPGWNRISAVENGRVYMLLYEFGCSPRVPITIAYMAKWFYPELFEDLDPKAIHQEYLTEFQGLDYDLDEHGVFVYPKPS